MHTLKEIKKALNLLDQYDGQIRKASRKLGINYYTLRSWKYKRDKNIPFSNNKRNKSSKWNSEQQHAAIEYYFNHGESLTKTVRKLGYPSRSTLMIWVKRDIRRRQKHKVNKKATFLTEEQKQSAIIDLITRDTSAKIVTEKYNVNTVSLYLWHKEITGEPAMKKDNLNKQEIENEIIELRKENAKLEIENKVLKKANEILKKEIGTDCSLLTNKEKTLVISALKNEFNIKQLLKIINLKRSTYFYKVKLINHDKYASICNIIKNIFFENYTCYGYRRIKQCLKNEHQITISDKVIIRIMKDKN